MNAAAIAALDRAVTIGTETAEHDLPDLRRVAELRRLDEILAGTFLAADITWIDGRPYACHLRHELPLHAGTYAKIATALAEVARQKREAGAA